MKFTKMQGAGNDYVYINCFEEQVKDPQALARKVSDRHFGIGSDGLVLIMPSTVGDFRMRMFNADGSEAEMCGNASRCVGKYVYDNGLTDKTSLKLETKAGIKHLQLCIKKGKVSLVTVDMGMPILEPSRIPVLSVGTETNHVLLHADGLVYTATAVSMGNPHAVLFVNKPLTDDLLAIGKEIERNPIFPCRTNVEFVQVLSDHEMNMRVWERGAGETLACGTGACAALVAAVLNKHMCRQSVVHLRGGDLQIEWRESDNHVYMTGEAAFVFDGEVYL